MFAAKIDAIDKFIFVNRLGLKAVEQMPIGLAKKLRDSLESVIGNLRETHHAQQAGGAYQPSSK